MYLCPKICFVKLVVKDFLLGRKNIGRLIYVFDLNERVPPLKPLDFEGGIHMCGCHFLEFLYCNIYDEEGGKMMVNLQHRRV